MVHVLQKCEKSLDVISTCTLQLQNLQGWDLEDLYEVRKALEEASQLIAGATTKAMMALRYDEWQKFNKEI